MMNSEYQKETNKRRNKRTGRTKKIAGGVLFGIGVIDFFTCVTSFAVSLSQGMQDIVMPLIFIVVGAWLFYSAKKNVEKWDQYDVLINQAGNTSLRMISQKTGKPMDKVRKDLQEMINNGFFKDDSRGIDAYINGEYDILVMTRNGWPLEPVEETARKQTEKEKAEAREKKRREAEEEALAEAAAEEKARKAAEARYNDPYANAIHAAAEKMDDPDVAQSLHRIENSIRRINKKIDRNPELEESKSVQQLRNIYLPKTMELVDKLTSGDAGPEAMLEIKGILNTCAIAYENIVDKVYEREDEDTLVDIEVLKQTFEREGLLGSDFDFE